MPAEQHPSTGPTETHPCAGIRVIDATNEYGAYAGRLLADLGAEVIRVEPRAGDPMRRREPLVEAVDGTLESAFAWFVNLNKRSVRLDSNEPDDRAAFLGLLTSADILLESWSDDDAASAELAEQVCRSRPDLIRVSITPFGRGGPRTGDEATDLTTLAAGGLLSLGGYPDAEPVAAHGGQSLLAASLFGAVAALIGLISRRRDGRGRHLDVSAQEAVAAALEDAIPQFDLTGRVRRRAGGDPREAGTGVMACKDGYVSIVAGRLGTARAWVALTTWLVEEGVEGAEELVTEAWTSFPYRQRPESIARFGEIFGRFASGLTKTELYLEAQRRNIALAPVNEIGDILEDPQMAARSFFRSVPSDRFENEIVVPGRPYRLAGDAGPVPRAAPRPGADEAELLGRVDPEGLQAVADQGAA